jgi:hypothetical protein
MERARSLFPRWARPPRRARQLIVILTAIGCCLGPALAWAASAASPSSTAVVRVRAMEFGRAIPRGFIGLSFEYGYVSSYAGTDASAINPVLVKLVGNVDPGGGFVLRIGGDSTDWSWWPVAGMAPPFPGIYALTPGWIAVVRSLLDAVHARAILGINLEAASPRLAAAEGRALLAGLGRGRIAAWEIGNEPELYSTRWYTAGGRIVPGRRRGYDAAAYMREFRRWRAVLPSLPLAAPASGSPHWLAGLTRFLSTQPGVSQITAHRYPLSNCVTNPGSPQYPTVPNLLASASSRTLVRQLAPDVAAAHRRGRRFRVDELNAVTCQGHAGVSDSAASALWALDTLFEMAGAGVDAVNVHVWPGAPAGQLFTFTETGGRWSGAVRPNYYGLLAFARAAPPGSRLLRTDLSGGSALRAWATLAPDHTLRLVVINASPTSAQTVLIHPPRRAPATEQLLTSPGPAATSGVTLAGQSVGSTGGLTGPPRQSDLPAARQYRLTLRPGSAALLTIAGQRAA